MDFINTALVTLSQPNGFWESIISSFKNGTGSYIVAVILIAVLVRFVFSFVDVINKKVTSKTALINEKMKPELDAVKAKYGNDPAMLQKKTNEIYQKYQFNMVGACFPTLIIMILNFLVFFTLLSSLQTMSNFNICTQYENMKNIYANVIDLNDADGTDPAKQAIKEYITSLGDSQYSLKTEIDFENNKMKIIVSTEGQQDFEREIEYVNNFSNEEIYGIVYKYVKQPEPENAEQSDEQKPQPPVVNYVDTGFNEIFKNFAEKEVEKYYIETQEGFLWVKNIYKPESPSSPMMTENEIKSYISKYYTEDEYKLENDYDYEGKLYKNVVAGIDTQALGVNGYYILSIIAILSSLLSMWLSNALMRSKNQPKQKQSWLMYLIMPLIFGIFTFMYTSLFAIYLIVGQLVMIILTPLTTWIVKKWTKIEQKKKDEKDVVEIDYRRKDF